MFNSLTFFFIIHILGAFLVNYCHSGVKIIGGKSTTIEEHPYQVALLYEGDYFYCGGVMISPQWVLTAAHCTYLEKNEPLAPADITVLANSTDNTFGETTLVAEIIAHEKFIYGVEDYDIAVLKLTHPLDCAYCNPITLSHNTPPQPYDMITVTGWGITDEYGIDNPTILQKIQVPVINQTVCAKTYLNARPSKRVTERMFCAGIFNIGGKDACTGDSGGPAVKDGELVGIVSWGIGCARPEYPGVYSSVSRYLPWITEKSGIS